jgi:Tyrosyl-DNA phosphodiesterase
VEEIRVSVEGYRGGGSVPGTIKNTRKSFLLPLYHKWSSSSSSYQNTDHYHNSTLTMTTAQTKPVCHETTKESVHMSPQCCNDDIHHSENDDLFLKRCYHIPHIKTYYQMSSTNENSFEWFVLTSHNLSKAAWGEIQKKNRGQLFVRHWELGVFLSSTTMVVDRIMPYNEYICSFGLPTFTTESDNNSNNNNNNNNNMQRQSDTKASTASYPAVTTIATIPLPYKLHPDRYQTFIDIPWAIDSYYKNADQFQRHSVTG